MKKVFSLVVVLFCLVGSVWGQIRPEVIDTKVTKVTCFGGNDGKIEGSINPGTGTFAPPYDVHLRDGDNVIKSVYNLNGGGFDFVFDDIPAGADYNIRITKAGQQIFIESFFSIITVSQPSFPFIFSAEPKAESGKCGALGQITALVSGGNAGSYTMILTHPDASSEQKTSISGSFLFDQLPAGTYSLEAFDAEGCGPIARQGLTIAASSPISVAEVTNSHQDVLCFGESTGSFEVEVTGSSTNYNYRLNGFSQGSGGKNKTFSDRPANDGINPYYRVSVDDGRGCSAYVDIVIVNKYPEIVLSVTSVTPISCKGSDNGSIIVTATGGDGTLTYSISPSPVGIVQSGGSFTNLPKGSYTVTVSDGTGVCSKSTDPIEIKEPKPLEFTIDSTSVSCYGLSTGALFVKNPTGGTGTNYSYQLAGKVNRGPQPSPDFTGLPAGNYSITVRDGNGCDSTATAKLADPAKLEVDDVTQKNVTCFNGSDGSITISAKGGTKGVPSKEYTFVCNGGAPQYGLSAEFSGLAAGAYTIVITDANGCSITETYTLIQYKKLYAGISLHEDVSCNNNADGKLTAQGKGGDGNYTYSWYKDEEVVSFASTAAITNLTPGYYKVIVTDRNGVDGCSADTTVQIIQPNDLDISFTGQVNNLCYKGSSGEVTAVPSGGTAPYTFQWNPAPGSVVSTSTTSTAKGLKALEYTVTVTDAHNCPPKSKAVTIEQPEGITVIAVAEDNPLVCVNGVTEITVTPAGSEYQYQLNGGAWSDNNVFTGIPAGTYSLNVRYKNTGDNCPSAGSKELVIVGLPTNITFDTNITNNICEGDQQGIIKIENVQPTEIPGSSPPAPENYQFKLELGSTLIRDFETDNEFTGLKEGIYTVTVMSSSGCIKTGFAELEDPEKIEPVATMIPATCPAGTDGKIKVDVTGGTGSFVYTIDPNEGTQTSSGSSVTFEGLTAGKSYDITVSESALSSCNATLNSITITAPKAISFDLEQTSIELTCYGDKATVTIINIDSDPALTVEYMLDGRPWQTSPVFTDVEASNTPYTVFARYQGSSCAAVTKQVSITDPASALDIAQVGVSVNPKCYEDKNGSATVLATGGWGNYTYSWKDASGNPISGTDATNSTLSGGTYWAHVVDKNGTGCKDSVMITIMPVDPIVVSVDTKAVSCYDREDGQATVTATGGNGGYTYQWDSEPAGNVTSRNDLAAGSHTVIVTDSEGCTVKPTAAVSFNITDRAKLEIGFDKTDETCAGAKDGQATAVVMPPGSYSYSWDTTPPQYTATATGLSKGDHTVTVTYDDSPTCSYPKTVTIGGPAAINIIDLIPAQDNLDCSNETTTLKVRAKGEPDVVLEYSLDNGTSQTAWQTDSVFVVTPGTYTAWVRYTGANACTEQSSMSKTISSRQAIVMTASADKTLLDCNVLNDKATITITVISSEPGASLLFSIDGNTWQSSKVFPNLDARTYTVRAMYASGKGCEANATITINSSSSIIINSATAVPQNLDCAGDKAVITIDATGDNHVALEYSFDNGATYIPQNTFEVTGAGTYNVAVKYLGENCPAFGSVVVSAPAELKITKVDFPAMLDCNGDKAMITVTATGGLNREYSLKGVDWHGNNISINWQDDNIFTGIEAGNYTVHVRYKGTNACEVTYPVVIKQPAAISNIVATADKLQLDCNGDVTTIRISADSDASRTLEYSINDGSNWYPNPEFPNQGAGTYAIKVRYASPAPSCMQDGPTLEITAPAKITNVTGVAGTSPLACDGSTTTITITADSDPDPAYKLAYSIDGGVTWFENDGQFAGVGVGSYQTMVSYVKNGVYTCVENGNMVIIESTSTISGVTLTANPLELDCNSAGTSTLTISVASSDAGKKLVYRINGGAWQDSPIFNYPEGTYIAEVAYDDDRTCVQPSASIRIKKNNPIVVDNVTINGVVTNRMELDCFNSTATVIINARGSGSMEYKLVGNTHSYIQTNNTFIDVEPDIYKVYVGYTGTYSCELLYGELNITAPVLLSIISAVPASTALACAGDSTTITITAVGDINRTIEYSIDGINWKWGPNGHIFRVAAGNYSAYARYMGSSCMAIPNPYPVPEIKAPAKITIVMPLVPDKTVVACDGVDKATITVTAYGESGRPLEYSVDGITWGLPDDNELKVGSGQYYVHVRYADTHSCEEISALPVKIDGTSDIHFTSVIPSPSKVNCYDDKATITATATFDNSRILQMSIDGSQWFDATGGSYTFTGLSAGNYYISARYKDDITCIITSGLVIIEQPDKINISLVGDPVDASGCGSELPGSATIYVNGGSGKYQYNVDNGSWIDFAGNTVVIPGLEHGQHTIYVRDDKSCQAEQPLVVDIANPDILQVTASVLNIRCFGEQNGQITISVKYGHAPYKVTVKGVTYTLASSSETVTVTGLSKGEYAVKAVDSKGCERSIYPYVEEPVKLQVTFSEVQHICPGSIYGSFQRNINGGWDPVSVEWYRNGVRMTPPPNPNHLLEGTYRIIAIDYAQCTDTADQVLYKLTELTYDEIREHGVRCQNPKSGSVVIVNPQGGNGGAYKFQVKDRVTQTIIEGFEWAVWPNDSIFGLGQGNYTLEMRDVVDDFCDPKKIPVTIGVDTGISIDDIAITNPKCYYSNDGKITDVTTSGAVSSLEYKLLYPNGSEIGWQSTAVFDTISTGAYTIYVREKLGTGNGCEAEKVFSVINPPEINIEITDKVDPNCENNPVGYIDFEAWGGTGNLTVTYNGIVEPGTFDPVDQKWKFHVEPSKGGWTVIEAKDANGCSDTVMRKIPYATDLAFDKIRIVPNKCPDDKNAQIKAIASDHGVSSHTSFTYRLYTGVATIPANMVGLPITPANLTDTASFEGLANGTYVLSMQVDGDGCFTNDSVVSIVNTNNIEISDIMISDNMCNGQSTGAIAFTITGNPSISEYVCMINGGLVITVSATNGVGYATVSPLPGGTYKVDVAYGECTLRDYPLGQVKDSYTVTPTITPVAVTGCNGNENGAIDIQMPNSNGFPFKYWYSKLPDGQFNSFTPNPNGTKTTISNLAAGSYDVIVKNNNGCLSNTIAVVVDDAPPMQIDTTVLTPITCKGQYGKIKITISGGKAPYTVTVAEKPDYAKDPVLTGSGSEYILDQVTGGPYKISVVDAVGCTNVLELDIYAPRVVEILVTQPTITCATSPIENTTVTVQVIKPTLGTFDYYMNGSGPISTTSLTQTYDLPTGTYKFEVREQSSSCLADTTIAVKIPQPMILSLPITPVDHGNCIFTADLGINITGGTAPFTIKMNNTTIPATNSTTLEGLPDGTYHIEVWDANNCYVDKTVKVELPTAINVKADIRDVKCNQDGKGSIVLNPVNPATYTYLWEDGTTSNALYDLNAGDYKVTISNGSCSIDKEYTVAASYTIDVTITPDGEDTHIFCPGTDVALNGLVTINGTPMSSTTSDAFANWILPNGDTKEYLTNNPLILTATNGTIQLTASSGGCTSMATFEMETKPTPTLAFATDTVYIPKDEVYTLKMSASDYASYKWTSTPDANYAQGLPAPPANVALASPDTPYTLTLTLTGENGCSVSDAIYVSRALDFFIPNAFTPNDDLNHDTWMFRHIEQYIDYYDIQVAVFNRGGFQVYSGKGYNNSSVVWDGRRNGNDLPIGTYYYVVQLVPKSPTGTKHTFKGSVTIIR